MESTIGASGDAIAVELEIQKKKIEVMEATIGAAGDAIAVGSTDVDKEQSANDAEEETLKLELLAELCMQKAEKKRMEELQKQIAAVAIQRESAVAVAVADVLPVDTNNVMRYLESTTPDYSNGDTYKEEYNNTTGDRTPVVDDDGPEKRMLPPPAMDNNATDNNASRGGYFSSSGFITIISAVVIAVVTIIIITLSLTGKDDTADSNPKPSAPPTLSMARPANQTVDLTATPTQVLIPPMLDSNPTTAPATPNGPTLAEQWKLNLGPDSGEANSGFGSAVSLAINTDLSTLVMVTGAPRSATGSDRNGVAIIYGLQNNVWAEVFTLSGLQNGGRFGKALELTETGTGLLVGAPRIDADATTTDVGAAYYYTIDLSVPTVARLGGEIRSLEDADSANEQFGVAVSTAASVDRIAIGAPGNSDGGQTSAGRVYTYELSNRTEWRKMDTEPLVGIESYDSFGSSVSISSNGVSLLIGAPGYGTKPGKVSLYGWDGSSWGVTWLGQGSQPTESFGSSVHVITKDGSVFAVGGAEYDGNQGVVRVYTTASGGLVEQLGDDIIGNPGERIGTVNRIFGTSTPLRMFAGTATGFVRIFDYNTTTSIWEDGGSVDTGFGSVAALSSSEAGNNFATGGSNKVSVYDETVPSNFLRY